MDNEVLILPRGAMVRLGDRLYDAHGVCGVVELLDANLDKAKLKTKGSVLIVPISSLYINWRPRAVKRTKVEAKKAWEPVDTPAGRTEWDAKWAEAMKTAWPMWTPSGWIAKDGKVLAGPNDPMPGKKKKATKGKRKPPHRRWKLKPRQYGGVIKN